MYRTPYSIKYTFNTMLYFLSLSDFLTKKDHSAENACNVQTIRYIPIKIVCYTLIIQLNLGYCKPQDRYACLKSKKRFKRLKFIVQNLAVE